MPYVGGNLADLFDTRPVRDAARRMADKGGQELHDRAERYTPVDSGEVKASWVKHPRRRTQRGTLPAYEVTVENPHWRAAMVEKGVKPHVIEPDSEEALDIPGGIDKPVAKVNHPGYPGRHMMSRAAAEVEVETPAILRPELERWADDQERTAARHRWITKT
jgi:hypothetical protein